MVGRNALRIRAQCRAVQILFACCGALLALCTSPPAQARPRLIVVQCDGFTLDDLHHPETPHLAALNGQASVAMVRCAPPAPGTLPGERTPAPEESPVALFGSAETTLFPGAPRTHVSRRDPEAPGGLVDDPAALAQAALYSRKRGVVLVLGDLDRAEAAREQLGAELYARARNDALRRVNLCIFLLREWLGTQGEPAHLLFMALRPPRHARLPTGVWGRLTPLLALGPEFDPPYRLTSATTRTPGLVDSADVPPTLSHLLGIPAPAPLRGRPIVAAALPELIEERWAALARIDYVAALNGQAQLRVMAPLTVLYCLLALGAVGLAWRSPARWRGRCAVLFVFLLSLPAALLLAPLRVPPTLIEYALRIAGWQIGLTAGAYLLARRVPLSPPVLIAMGTTVLIAGDLLTGQALLKDSVLSCTALYGVRYYGLTNEYLGVLLGFLFLGGSTLLDDLRVPAERRRARWALMAGWGVLMGLFGWPDWGANAGSLIVMGAGMAAGTAYGHGVRRVALRGIAGAAAGMVLALAFAALDRRLSAESASHLGHALAAASAEGPSRLMQIVTGKIGLNLRLLFTWWFVLTALAVCGIVLMALRLLQDALRRALARCVWMARGVPSVTAAMGAALIFKDTGAVTVTYALGASCLILFYRALMEPPA